MGFFGKFKTFCSKNWEKIRKKLFRGHPIRFEEIYEFGLLAESVYESESSIRARWGDKFDQLDIFHVGETQIQYLLATDHKTKRHIIAIQGTSNLKTTLLNFAFLTSRDFQLDIRLHRGFSRAAYKILQDVTPRLKGHYRIQITGHSLGGAQAVVLGMYLDFNGWQVDKIVTFGQPMVTDREGVSRFRHLPILRVVEEADMVPWLPPVRLLYFGSHYRHLGRELLLLGGPYYSYLDERPAELKWIYAFFRRVKYKYILAGEIKEHLISHYLTNIEQKLSQSSEVPYRERSKYKVSPLAE